MDAAAQSSVYLASGGRGFQPDRAAPGKVLKDAAVFGLRTVLKF